jgi:hypothetical protein
MPSVEYTQVKGLVQKSSTDAALDLRGELSGFRKKIVPISAAANTLKNEDSGKVFLVTHDANNDIDITLPAVPETGVKYRVITAIDVAVGKTIEVLQGNAGHDFAGTLYQAGAEVDRANLAANNAAEDDSKIQFVANAAKAGDFIELFYTGSKWSVQGVSQAAGGLVFVV